jgi:oligopeptide/dipeptide ABC transporter ATP-binding protein
MPGGRLEASGSAHHWARELIKLGHDARRMPPAYVKPYIRRQKNDAADAAAISEAVTRPSMRFVGVRSLENQAALMRHKAREMLVSQRTQLLNGLRGHLTEVGVIAAQGPASTRNSPILICLDGVEHPYSASLLSLTSQINSHDRKRDRLLLPGEIPSPRNPPSGCRFHTRCSYASDRRREEAPVLETIGEGREVACHLWRQIRDGAL